MDLALYQPDFAHNVGGALRLGACLGVHVHIIHPVGFTFSRRALRQGGLDYVDPDGFTEHAAFAAFEDWRRAQAKRLVLLTTSASTSAYQTHYSTGDVLLVGRESAGVPESVAACAELSVRVPMRRGARSLNVAAAAGLVLGEALRQTGGFDALT